MATILETESETAYTGLVDGPRLLEILFPNQACRPSLRWLRTQTKAKSIPHVRLGRLVFFDVQVVRTALASKSLVQARTGRGAPDPATR